MHLLYAIIYAAHAHGTHHKLALDALRRLEGPDREAWQRLFLKHADLYLEGSKAPDQQFKDFKNHVLHTREDYWGGAPQKVVSWYQHLVEALSQGDWQTAAYCAGVLSHYYTDPLHPFHTGQSEAENNIHRAVEWSIAKSYDQLRAEASRQFPQMPVTLSEDANWLLTLVVTGAQRANAYYEKLIAHYDIQRGVVDPPAGLDPIARRVIAELIQYATASYALVLGRAIEEAHVRPPQVPLTAATLLATLKVPFKLLVQRIADRSERRQIERSYDELIAEGKVDRTLGDHERVVRDLYAEEVLAKRGPPPLASQVFPFTPRPRVVTHIERTATARRAAAAHDNVVAFAALRPPALKPPVGAEQKSAARPRAGLSLRLQQVTAATPRRRAPASAGTAPPARLSLDQDVVMGPSIGPKTASRLYPHGIKTVRDLIKADPTALSVLIGARHITPELISGWQDQARLVCTLPGLAGTHAQLLVGAGYTSAQAIAAAAAEKLCTDVINFALTTAGQRLLRQAEMPDLEKIKGWQETARSVQAA
jgi:Domain of unknown function (DUF4332)/Zinc dependent phospholipase C